LLSEAPREIYTADVITANRKGIFSSQNRNHPLVVPAGKLLEHNYLQKKNMPQTEHISKVITHYNVGYD
jgi:hypothetical protein